MLHCRKIAKKDLILLYLSFGISPGTFLNPHRTRIILLVFLSMIKFGRGFWCFLIVAKYFEVNEIKIA